LYINKYFTDLVCHSLSVFCLVVDSSLLSNLPQIQGTHRSRTLWLSLVGNRSLLYIWVYLTVPLIYDYIKWLIKLALIEIGGTCSTLMFVLFNFYQFSKITCKAQTSKYWIFSIRPENQSRDGIIKHTVIGCILQLAKRSIRIQPKCRIILYVS